ncbi:hypothetical protein H696_02538 [Fonticula alba]|uniref:Uncharacterized protein n=1 Tax=Fonticula alba TaxID=691883 RepID=A0A058ZAZ7_FONAL|nr:hypothetical protein H696_02538 [Fonticula alba]KCV71595.1 hypothetical protein H696_02538 [Fonticula alba]|eukprot:XP_009494718.1 hypothetical protein H696_02538 [Fonticula alba]
MVARQDGLAVGLATPTSQSSFVFPPEQGPIKLLGPSAPARPPSHHPAGSWQSDRPIAQPVADGVAGLPGHFFLGHGSSWVWLHEAHPRRVVPTGRPVLGTAATRLRTYDPIRQDLMVLTDRPVLVYIGLGTDRAWQQAHTFALMADRLHGSDLPLHLVPPVMRMSQPTGYLNGAAPEDNALWQTFFQALDCLRSADGL